MYAVERDAVRVWLLDALYPSLGRVHGEVLRVRNRRAHAHAHKRVKQHVHAIIRNSHTHARNRRASYSTRVAVMTE